MKMLLGSYIDSKLKSAVKSLETRIQVWQNTAYSVVIFAATMVIMFWASVFLYMTFYFTYLPQESVTWPVLLSYRACKDRPGICSNPYATVKIIDPSQVSPLVHGQRYRVVVDLEMPESFPNQRNGMFLVTVELYSNNGTILESATRSTMLRYKSPLLHTLSTFVFAPLLLYGIQEEKQTVSVELFPYYDEDRNAPLSEVNIEIGSRHVEIYSAQLRIHAIFSGIRYVMYNHPVTAAVVGIGVCMNFLAVIVIISWLKFSSIPQTKQLPAGGVQKQLSVTTTDVAVEKVKDEIPERKKRLERSPSIPRSHGQRTATSKEADVAPKGDTTQGNSQDLKVNGVAQEKLQGTELGDSEQRKTQEREDESPAHEKTQELENVQFVIRHRLHVVEDDSL